MASSSVCASGAGVAAVAGGAGVVVASFISSGEAVRWLSSSVCASGVVIVAVAGDAWNNSLRDREAVTSC